MRKKLVIVTCIVASILIIIFSAKTIKVEKVDVDNPDSQVKSIATEEILMKVLQNEKEFIDESGNEITINNLKIEDNLVKINSYAFADIDQDNENELIAITDSYYDYYLILDIDSNIIYGYYIHLNEMDYINNKGIILDKDEDNIIYSKYKFNKNKIKKINVASYIDSEYLLNNQKVEQQDFDNYQEEFAKEGLINYRALSTEWMDKKLSSEYSLKIEKTYNVKSDTLDFMFAIDKEFDNFKSDLLNDIVNVYYINSNNDSGKLLIRRANDSYDILKDELANKMSVGIYDEETQYIAIVINKDKLSSSLDNNYDIYYFKYYNKNMQFLAKHNVDDYKEIFNEDIISNLN